MKISWKTFSVLIFGLSLVGAGATAATTTAHSADRHAKFEAALAACEQYMAQQGTPIQLPRPPARPNKQQWEAIRACGQAGIIPAPKWHHHHHKSHKSAPQTSAAPPPVGN